MKKIGFDFKDKFIFVKRIEGVSGTKIREAVISDNLKSAEEMMPPETIQILKEQMDPRLRTTAQYTGRKWNIRKSEQQHH